MSDFSGGFQRLDLRNASEHEHSCLVEFKNKLNKEYYPDDPPVPSEEQIQGWKNIPDLLEVQAHVSWNSSCSQILASCDTDIENKETNKHIAYFRIEVLPAYRCQGLARQMLKLILPFAKERNRSLLMGWVNDRISAAEIFMEHIGARKGLDEYTNQLRMAEFDQSLMDRWLEKSKNLAGEFEMGLWDGAVPEEHIAEIADLMGKLINDQPRDSLEMEDMKFTPEILRQIEKYLFGKGNKRWILYIVDCANQKFVGLTEVVWSPGRPSILNQGFTAVDSVYRNKGLGRWLKASMMKKILQERPEVQFIRTGNANSNAPMLKINHEMGFKPYFANTLWQVDVAQIETYLDARNVR